MTIVGTVLKRGWPGRFEPTSPRWSPPLPATAGDHARIAQRAARASLPGDHEVMDLPADPGQVLIALTTEPNSSSPDALNLLASWAATQDDRQAMPVEEDA